MSDGERTHVQSILQDRYPVDPDRPDQRLRPGCDSHFSYGHGRAADDDSGAGNRGRTAANRSAHYRGGSGFPSLLPPKPTATQAPVPTPLPRDFRSGDLIAYYSDRDGNPEIYVMNPDGSDQRRLTSSPFEDSSPDWSPDGTQLVFASKRDGNVEICVEEAASRRPNVWFVDRTETGWSEPQFVGPPLNDYQPVYFSFANDGTLYFTRSSPRGIYYAEPEEGQYREAHRLPDEINDVRNVAHPAVAPDESYLIVDSAYEQGGRLVGSLYVSFRRPDGSWTKAVSLHDVLNASEADVYAIPRITPDGKYLFFEKYDRETDRSDIYWVSTDVIRKLGPTVTSDLVATDPASACPLARGAGTVAPAVAIYSITFVVNGLEQVVRDGDTLQASSGDRMQVRDVTICAGPFSGNGGEACVDFVPVSQSGQEFVSEHGGTHIVRVTPGFMTISGPSHVWTVGENWWEIAAVLNHWPPRNTEDLSCGGGRCERDDRVATGLRRNEGH